MTRPWQELVAPGPKEAETARWLAGHAFDDPAPHDALRLVLMELGLVPTPEVEARKRRTVPPSPPPQAEVAAQEPVSNCCGAAMETAGSVTRYYVCSECGMPCDMRAAG